MSAPSPSVSSKFTDLLRLGDPRVGFVSRTASTFVVGRLNALTLDVVATSLFTPQPSRSIPLGIDFGGAAGLDLSPPAESRLSILFICGLDDIPISRSSDIEAAAVDYTVLADITLNYGPSGELHTISTEDGPTVELDYDVDGNLEGLSNFRTGFGKVLTYQNGALTSVKTVKL